MKRAWQIFKQHYIAIIAYLPYSFFCYNVAKNILWLNHNMKMNLERAGIPNGGKVFGFGMFFISLYAIVYGIIILINAIYSLYTKPSSF
jgi:hypothetical protein